MNADDEIVAVKVSPLVSVAEIVTLPPVVAVMPMAKFPVEMFCALTASTPSLLSKEAGMVTAMLPANM